MPRSSAQKRTPFKAMRTKIPFARSCIECGRKLTTTFLYCPGDGCSGESKRKIRKQMKVGEYAPD